MNNKRKLLWQVDGKISILQFVGFVSMLFGILAMVIASFHECQVAAAGIPSVSECETVPSIIAVSFFIIMLGMSFAFPSLLEGNDGLSTMRIVVFMITNIICMLLLKIGWAKGIRSLKDIGLDQYWVGVIAFVFGAKAAQSFFESKMAAIQQSAKACPTPATNYSNAEIAQLAVSQYSADLKASHPNIVSVSDAVRDLAQTDSHVVALYLKDNNTKGIPSSLDVTMPDKSVRTIPTEIIPGVGKGTTHANQRDEISNNPGSRGSICCIVSTSNNYKAVVTAGHVCSDGDSVRVDPGSPAFINGLPVGKWLFQQIDFKNDLALATIDSNADDSYISFAGKKHYKVTDADVTKTTVKLVSHVSGERYGYILDYNNAWDVEYADGIFQKNGIILIGSTKDRMSSVTVSAKGDSGGVVYEPASGDLVGLILGGNDKFTWVLSLKDIFFKEKFQLI